VTAPELRLAVSDAPATGDVRMVELDGHRIGLYRVGDAYFAIADRCPHRAAPLCSAGRVVRGVALEHGVAVRGDAPALVRCPWHRWDFEIATGRCLVHPRLRLRRYRVEREGDDLVISLRQPANAEQ
jgi:nitrite reductase/ring-hydroxylating ferredoxin subunit